MTAKEVNSDIGSNHAGFIWISLNEGTFGKKLDIRMTVAEAEELAADLRRAIDNRPR